MTDARSGVMTGLERRFVFSRLRAAVGLRWELPRLLAGLTIPDGPRCLEVGAGLGWGAVGLARRFPEGRIIATEYDETALPALRAYVGARAGDAVSIRQADARALPFPDSQFDLVMALYALHHVGGYQRALAEIARVTRPGGVLVFIEMLRPSWWPNVHGRHAPEGLLSRREFVGLLEGAGFEVERWRGALRVGGVARQVAGVVE